jgi:succinyl-diaminopimelate desuccinylase
MVPWRFDEGAGPIVPMSPRDRILAWIEADRDHLVAFLSTLVAIPSANPPGDTREAADFLLRSIREEGAPAEIRAAKDHLPNVVGSFEAGRSGRHLVLNGHIDVFPAGPAEGWSRDPWSGAIENGRVHGRGVADMKCGTAASLWTYVYLHRLRDEIGGRLTLTCVSDEETGGTWGAQWLVDSFPEEFRGDCMLNGEPSVPTMVRFGEKGTLRLAIEIDTPGAHAAYTHTSPNAIRLAASLIGDLYDLEGLPVVHNEALVGAVAAGAKVIDAGLGDGASKILNKVTVSVGTIQGGVKINMLPGHCRFEVDIRLPVGLTHAVLLAEVERILSRYPQAKLTPIWTHSCEPTLSAPDHEMVAILKRTVRELGRVEPVASVSLGATDCKHWRRSGVPSYVYGCSPTNMAKPDEYVDVEEYLHIVRTHALAAAAYLAL